MAGIVRHRVLSQPARRGSEESPAVRWALIALAGGFAMIFLFLPILNVFAQAASLGGRFLFHSLTAPYSLAAIRLTLLICLIVVPLNAVFGVAAAWAIAKFQFRGKALILALIDLPFAVSPIVVGLMLVVLFGKRGFLGDWLEAEGIPVIFHLPGQVIATLFITFPFTVRELIPVMEANGSEQEQAALTLGAGGWRTFWFVTLPGIKWGLLYGVILCNARAMGEFGAVFVVTNSLAGVTQTIPLRIFELHQGTTTASAVAAFGMASLLAVLGLLTLAVKTWLEWKQHREESRAQEAIHEH